MRVLSGVQPTGQLHLGNYIGAIQQFVTMQDQAECFFCVVDMHAITVKHDPKLLGMDTRKIAAAYLACGIDPAKATVFAQSHVPAHAEMMWLLSGVARIGWLERMTQFREKTGTVPPPNLRDSLKAVKEALSGCEAVLEEYRSDYRSSYGEDAPADAMPPMSVQYADVKAIFDLVAGKASNAEKASVGLFTYPVLMAADILAYKATHVPVGADQVQHLNLARDIAEKFNHDYGDLFPVPEAVRATSGARIMSLQDASRKMSKSDPDPLSRISLTDNNDAISKAIRRATADTKPFPTSPEQVPNAEIENLITIYQTVSGQSRETIFDTFGGHGYGMFKPELTSAVIALIEPIRTKMEALVAAPDHLDSILRNGAIKAQALAGQVVRETKEKMGFQLPQWG